MKMTEPLTEAQTSGRLADAQPIRKTTWAWIVATFFGAGYWKPGPGTAGSIAAAAVWLLVGNIGWGKLHIGGESNWVFVGGLSWLTATAALFLLIIGIPASTIVAQESDRKDPPFVVADEAVGQWIALLTSPCALRYAVFGLVLFRLFDIWKPFPIRNLERLPVGWGIMLDDVGAGIYAWMVVQFLRHWLR
jgi:phosphatidylglycerophosphatase A